MALEELRQKGGWCGVVELRNGSRGMMELRSGNGVRRLELRNVSRGMVELRNEKLCGRALKWA